MSEYRPPSARDALRIYFKACWMVVEPAFVALVMLGLGAPWWAFVALVLLWLPLGRLRLRDLKKDWIS